MSDGIPHVSWLSYSMPGSGVNGAFLDGGPNALVSNSNVGIDGRFLFEMRSTGSTQFTPVLPSAVDSGGFFFDDVSSGQWFDPPIAEGFTYTMSGESLFTTILDFPAGFNSDFEIIVDGTILGTFHPGDTVDFTTFEGGGVASFTIMGIDPLVDPEDPSAFPLQLAFSTSTASFTMVPINVPEPATLGLLAMAGLGLMFRRRSPVDSQKS